MLYLLAKPENFDSMSKPKITLESFYKYMDFSMREEMTLENIKQSETIVLQLVQHVAEKISNGRNDKKIFLVRFASYMCFS